MDGLKNEQFREYCYLGDLELIQNFHRDNAPDVNSQNKMNGWTSLHWAAKQNHFKIVKFLLSVGADAHVVSKDGRLPGDFATDDSVRSLFNLKPVEKKNEDPNRFVPAFKKHPEFHYANKELYNNTPTKEKPVNLDESEQIRVDPGLKRSEAVEEIPAKSMRTETSPRMSMISYQESDQNIITVKVKCNFDEDFIELDINKGMSFEKFKATCLEELENHYVLPVVKIRKLPNVLMRDDRDMGRLKDNQEIEFVFAKRN